MDINKNHPLLPAKPLPQGPPLLVKEDQNEANNISLMILKDYLDVYKSHPLVPSKQDPHQMDQGNLTIYFTTETTLCHNNFCCDFKVWVIQISILIIRF